MKKFFTIIFIIYISSQVSIHAMKNNNEKYIYESYKYHENDDLNKYIDKKYETFESFIEKTSKENLENQFKKIIKKINRLTYMLSKNYFKPKITSLNKMPNIAKLIIKIINYLNKILDNNNNNNNNNNTNTVNINSLYESLIKFKEKALKIKGISYRYECSLYILLIRILAESYNYHKVDLLKLFPNSITNKDKNKIRIFIDDVDVNTRGSFNLFLNSISLKDSTINKISLTKILTRFNFDKNRIHLLLENRHLFDLYKNNKKYKINTKLSKRIYLKIINCFELPKKSASKVYTTLGQPDKYKYLFLKKKEAISALEDGTLPHLKKYQLDDILNNDTITEKYINKIYKYIVDNNPEYCSYISYLINKINEKQRSKVIEILINEINNINDNIKLEKRLFLLHRIIENNVMEYDKILDLLYNLAKNKPSFFIGSIPLDILTVLIKADKKNSDEELKKKYKRIASEIMLSSLEKRSCLNKSFIEFLRILVKNVDANFVKQYMNQHSSKYSEQNNQYYYLLEDLDLLGDQDLPIFYI